MRAHTHETQSAISPRLALEFLREGNQRFVSKAELIFNQNLGDT